MNPLIKTETSRRQFLTGATAAALGGASPLALAKAEHVSVVKELGVTTGSFFSHITFESGVAGKIQMLDLPKVMRDELDMKVIDLMSRTLESFEPSYLEKLRQAAVDHGCVITNLKLNQRGIDIASSDDETRREGLKIYKESIDAAALLGCRWVRPVAGGGKNPNRDRLTESFRELIDYGAKKDISILIENTGWVAKDATAIPDMIRRVGAGLTASPDTGNWSDEPLRQEGLKAAYPFASTSDFKAFQLESDGSHPKYDLKQCFQIGWDAGFRGPWCIEHFHEDLPGLIAGFAEVRDRLRKWIAEAE